MCRAVVRTPGPVATQVNERLGSSSVTTYSVGGIRGCSTRTRGPTASGPSSRSRTEVTVAAHSGHRSTSRSTSQTCSTGVSTSILVLCSTGPSCSWSLLEIDQDYLPHASCLQGSRGKCKSLASWRYWHGNDRARPTARHWSLGQSGPSSRGPRQLQRPASTPPVSARSESSTSSRVYWISQDHEPSQT